MNLPRTSAVAPTSPHALSRRLASTAVAFQTNPAATTAPVQADMHHDLADAQTPSIHSFFEKATGTWQYVLSDPTTSKAVIIDPVLDYDPASGAISTKSADRLLAFIKQQGLEVVRILYVSSLSYCMVASLIEPRFFHCSETHAHADHLTASQYLKRQLGGVPVGIGARITQVQQKFAPRYGFDDAALLEGTFDTYFRDDDEFQLGELSCRVVHLPGHTPDHIGYVFGKAIFTGDSIFNVRRSYRPPIGLVQS